VPVSQYKQQGNSFSFNCGNCTNFTLLPVTNSGPNDGTCFASSTVFKLYDYLDANLTYMIFKNELMLQPALGCLNTCQSCMPANLSFCTQCIAPLLSQEGSCQPQCNLGYYQVGFQCSSCPQACSRCSSSLVCTLCDPRHLLFQGGCVPECPAYFYNGTGSCKQCGDNCPNCTNGS